MIRHTLEFETTCLYTVVSRHFVDYSEITREEGGLRFIGVYNFILIQNNTINIKTVYRLLKYIYLFLLYLTFIYKLHDVDHVDVLYNCAFFKPMTAPSSAIVIGQNPSVHLRPVQPGHKH